MHRTRLSFLLLATLAGASALAHAEGATVGFSAGTRALNLELGYSFNPAFGVRAVGTDLSPSYETSKDDVKYKGKLNLKSVSLLGDFYPMQGAFRITAGAVFNHDTFTGHAVSENGFVIINGVPYPVSSGDSVQARATYPHDVMPYLGIGWGNPSFHKQGIGVTADLGAIYTDHAHATLTATGPDAANPTLLAALQQEQDRLNHDLHKVSVYPVASVGVYYGF